MKQDNTQTHCFHCDLPVADTLNIYVNYQGEQKAMCCYGCQAVSQAIISSGMDEFYRFRTHKANKPTEILPEFIQQLKAYDSKQVQDKFVSQTDNRNIREVSLILEGITCAACVWLNEQHLNALDGVLSANINYSNYRALVRWDNNKIQLSEILESISHIGYLAHPYDPKQYQLIIEKERKQQIKRLGLTGLLGMQVMILAIALYTGDWWGINEGFKQSFRWASFVVTLPILLFASSVFFKSAYRDLKNKRVGMDVPVSLGILIAFIASTVATIKGVGHVYYDSVAMFTFFLLVARFFELSVRKKTSETTEAMLNLKPSIATRLTNYKKQQSSAIEHQQTIAVSELNIDDYLLVRPGEVIPTDGVIIHGCSGINESLITGESMPITKQEGEKVIGGSTNTESPLIVQITQLGEGTVLNSIQNLISQAQHNKPSIAIFADKVAHWFVAILLSISAIVAYYWYNTDPAQWLEITIATLVISCPCALSLATPTALTAASGQLAKIGLLPKRAHALETLAKATDFVFDKTGTLTQGKIKLIKTHCYHQQKTEEEVLKIATSLEANSEHPIARALINANQQKLLKVTQLKHFSGLGITGKIEKQCWFIGNQAFIETNCQQKIDQYPNQGSPESQIFLATEALIIASFTLTDKLRDEAIPLIKKLQTHNKKIHLMSGDNTPSVEKLCQQLHLTNCHAQLKPADKLNRVKALQKLNAIVVMTGDGINDAPVLAGADLSIAMGNGTQLAAATADMLLISNNIEHIYYGYLIATHTLQKIKQNLSWAVIYNIIAIPAAALGYVEPWLAAIGMSSSSLVVVLNSLRLNRIKLSK